MTAEAMMTLELRARPPVLWVALRLVAARLSPTIANLFYRGLAGIGVIQHRYRFDDGPWSRWKHGLA